MQDSVQSTTQLDDMGAGFLIVLPGADDCSVKIQAEGCVLPSAAESANW
jgi:hypothetical protein